MSDAPDKPTLTSLQELGFSEYEAKAYLALLRHNPASAYEIAKFSGIPSSKIYQVLAKLVERAVVLAIEDTQRAATSYAPLSPAELIASQRQRMASRLDSLERQLAEEHLEAKLSYIWNFHDYPSLREQVSLLVRDARRELILSIWREDADLVLPLVPTLVKRGVKVAMIIYGLEAFPPGETATGPFAGLAPRVSVYPHPIASTLYQERGGRGLSAVADGCRALTATVFADNTVEGAWSLNRGFALLAEDYIKHDIYLMKIVERMDERLVGMFGEGYALLRNVFSNQVRT